MYNDLDAPHCTCHYQYAWHYEGPKRAMESWDSVLSEYAEDCTIGQHAALAALLAPKPEPSGWHAEMRRRANDEREQVGLPREDEPADPHAKRTNRYIARLTDFRDRTLTAPTTQRDIDVILDLLFSIRPEDREEGRQRAARFLPITPDGHRP